MKKVMMSLAIGMACAASANAITVDGVRDADYGSAKSVVTYNPAAPNSNFGAPTSEAQDIGYSIYLRAADDYVYGYIQTTPSPGASAPGAFANLYWNVAPGPYDGTEIGFELSPGSQNFFIPGRTNYGAVSDISVVLSADGTGLEFAIPDHYFTTALSYVTDYYRTPSATIGTEVTLGLSQSFGYSVAGGTSYGSDRLGSVILRLGPVPEPATWAMMVGGFGLVGSAMRRRKVAFA